MNGLRPAVVGMIAASLLSVAGTALTLEAGWPALAAGAVLLLAALVASWKEHPPHPHHPGLGGGGRRPGLRPPPGLLG